MLYEFCPIFSVQFFSSRTVGSISRFGSFKRAEIIPLPIKFDASNKFAAALVKAYAFVAGRIILLFAAISVILRGRSFAEIFPPVIRFYFVKMVNFKFWPFSSHVYPDDSMGKIIFVFNPYFYAALVIENACDSSDWRSPRQPFFPDQYSRFLVVVKNFADEIRRQIVMRIFMSSHAGSYRACGSFVKGW